MLPNQVYYFLVGKGKWGGAYDFRLTDRRAYRQAQLGLMDRLLIVALRLVITLLGKPVISSEITVDPEDGPAGTAWNLYSLSKLKVTLCLIKDVYQLDADGEGVRVSTDLRYGPIPGILTDHFDCSARIVDGGYRCQYDGLRLLGGTWQADYSVATDRDHVIGTLTCEWGEAMEQMHRLDGG
jgi:hypothetical protein